MYVLQRNAVKELPGSSLAELNQSMAGGVCVQG